jgi:hypothetical protein
MTIDRLNAYNWKLIMKRWKQSKKNHAEFSKMLPGSVLSMLQKAVGCGRASSHIKRWPAPIPTDNSNNLEKLSRRDYVNNYYNCLPVGTPSDQQKTEVTLYEEWAALLLFELGYVDANGNIIESIIPTKEIRRQRNVAKTSMVVPSLTSDDLKMVPPAKWSTVDGGTKRQESLIASLSCMRPHLVPDLGYDTYVESFSHKPLSYLEDQAASLHINVNNATVSENHVRALEHVIECKKAEKMSGERALAAACGLF